MKTVNLITGKNVKFTLFPDGQPHLELVGAERIERGDFVNVVCRLRYANDVLHLLQVSEVLDRIGAIKSSLSVSYLMAARYDRPMAEADSFDLRVIASLINSCRFVRVFLFDPHSKVAEALIINSTPHGNGLLVEEYKRTNSVLIVPDKGARDKVPSYLKLNHNIKDVVFCEKSRELSTGKITLRVLQPENCAGRNCVIIDDICDGGGTFLEIAKQITPAHLTLIVSHGIFSKGRSILFDNGFDEIITTDSYQYQNPRKGLTVFRLYEPTITH